MSEEPQDEERSGSEDLDHEDEPNSDGGGSEDEEEWKNGSQGGTVMSCAFASEYPIVLIIVGRKPDTLPRVRFI